MHALTASSGACVAISVVNGYLCFNSCEAATASKGQNPRAKTDAVTSGGDAAGASGSSPLDRPAVTLGGALRDASSPTAIAPAGAVPNAQRPSPPSVANTVDVLA